METVSSSLKTVSSFFETDSSLLSASVLPLVSFLRVLIVSFCLVSRVVSLSLSDADTDDCAFSSSAFSNSNSAFSASRVFKSIANCFVSFSNAATRFSPAAFPTTKTSIFFLEVSSVPERLSICFTKDSRSPERRITSRLARANAASSATLADSKTCTSSYLCFEESLFFFALSKVSRFSKSSRVVCKSIWSASTFSANTCFSPSLTLKSRSASSTASVAAVSVISPAASSADARFRKVKRSAACCASRVLIR